MGNLIGESALLEDSWLDRMTVRISRASLSIPEPPRESLPPLSQRLLPLTHQLGRYPMRIARNALAVVSEHPRASPSIPEHLWASLSISEHPERRINREQGIIQAPGGLNRPCWRQRPVDGSAIRQEMGINTSLTRSLMIAPTKFQMKY